MAELLAVVTAVRSYSAQIQAEFTKSYECDILQIPNGEGQGICQKYNTAIDKLSGKSEEGWIIFTHDDVSLQVSKQQLLDQLSYVGQQAEIIAVAGNTKLPPLFPGYWWYGLTTKEFRGTGAVVHKTPGTKDLLHIESYGPYPQQIAAFDGLWFAVKKRVFSQIRFDPRFDGYHYYDADFGAEARSKNIPMWTAGVLVFHHQWGKGVEDPEFKRYQQRFIDKWKTKLEGYKTYNPLMIDSNFVTETSAF